MNIFVTGSSGMLGSSLCDVLSKHHVVTGVGPNDLDVTKSDKWPELTSSSLHNLDAIIHCAAYTQVDAAERIENRQMLWDTNVESIHTLCDLCLKHDIRLIFPQTFLVLRGQDEFHPANSRSIDPLSWYAKSKWEAEKIIIERLPPELRMIVSMGGFYGGGSDKDKNFIGLFLNKILPTAIRDGKKSIEIGDRVWQPTWVNDIAHVINWVLNNPWRDFYQYATSDYASFAELAQTIITSLGVQGIKINQISSSQISEIAPRPKKIIMRSSEELVRANLVHDYRSRLNHYLNENWSNYSIQHY